MLEWLLIACLDPGWVFFFKGGDHEPKTGVLQGSTETTIGLDGIFCATLQYPHFLFMIPPSKKFNGYCSSEICLKLFAVSYCGGRVEFLYLMGLLCVSCKVNFRCTLLFCI